MNVLKKCGLTDNDINEIIANNDTAIIENLNINEYNVEDILNYLIGIGINLASIKEIFMYQIGLFYKTKEEIRTSFDEYEIDSIVKSLNYDINNIELIDFI